MGERSLPAWNGTVVQRPLAWRYCLCEPLCRTSTKPRFSSRVTTSLGFKIGCFSMAKPP
jgi:hypothetical protein